MAKSARPPDVAAASMPWMASIPPCLHIPIAARDEKAIERFVGAITSTRRHRGRINALVVESHQPPSPGLRLPVWGRAEAAMLHAETEVWVHVDYRRYVHAYKAANPGCDLLGKDVDHTMNRQIARLKGFDFVRIMPLAHSVNRSSGAVAEKWGIAYAGRPGANQRDNPSGPQVQYADLADLVKMIGIATGGGFMDAVNDAQHLFELP